MNKLSAIFAALFLLAGAVASAQPKPYDDSDRHPAKELGLPKNYTGDAPTKAKPAPCVSYSAYTHLGDWYGKIFYNAARKRTYSVIFEIDGSARHSLAIEDSLAIYNIDHAAKTIVKMPMNDFTGSLDVMNHTALWDVDTKLVSTEYDIVGYDDRWTQEITRTWVTTTRMFDGSAREESSTNREYIDLEYGIPLCTPAHDHLYQVTIGLSYPEIFDLPQGYTFSVMNATSQAEQMRDAMPSEEVFKDIQKQMDPENIKKTMEGINNLFNKLK